MKITDISAQVKRPDRYNIFIDDSFAFSLSGNALLNSGIKVGDSLDDAQLQRLKDKSEADIAYSKLLQLIARRPRSVWEAEQYLKKKGYDVSSIEDVIATLKTKSHLDDRAFAESWIRSRRLTRSTSQRKLRYELQQKHVSEQIVNECLADDETTDKDVLRELIEKKTRQTRYQDRDKLMRYLAGQGFHYGDIKEVLGSEEFSQQ